MLRSAGLAILLLGSGSVAAEDGAERDRAELDAAAGRALFQPSSLYEAVVPARPVTRPVDPPGTRRRRDGVRVVYPGPYDR